MSACCIKRGLFPLSEGADSCSDVSRTFSQSADDAELKATLRLLNALIVVLLTHDTDYRYDDIVD